MVGGVAAAGRGRTMGTAGSRTVRGRSQVTISGEQAIDMEDIRVPARKTDVYSRVEG
jgi:hypothetical protein